MNIQIIFPPVSDPRGPHLAPAALAAALRRAGHRVVLRDLDLELALFLLQPDILQEHLHKARALFETLDVHGPRSDWKTLAWRQKIGERLSNAEAVIKKIPDQVAVLQGDRFYDSRAYYAARRMIDAALGLVCCSCDYDLSYTMDGQNFETRFDAAHLGHLLEAVKDDRANLFGALYERRGLHDTVAARPDMAGICILNYQQILPGLTLAKKLKDAGLFVVIGGTVFSKFIDALEQNPAFFTLCNAVAVCEGETALCRLADELARSPAACDLAAVPNLIWADNGAVRVNRPFHVEDLGRLPEPDFTGLPLERYLAPATVLPYNLGKGCYWNSCRFCEIPLINNLSGARYRVKTARLIVDQLEELSQRFHTPYFQFTDESCPPELLEEMTDLIMARNLKINYLCYARLEEGFTEEQLKKLHAGGLRKLMFGLESGSDRMLKIMNKGITAAQAERVIRNCGRAHVNFKLFVIMGLPGETLEDAWETRLFLQSVSPVLKDPLNHVEINLFHLDAFSCFGKNLDRFGITLPGKDRGEFYLGTSNFSCPGSMDKKALHQFISQTREELASLTDMQAKHSGWEEYSLLCASRAKP
ncbi:MAG: radical SAM protein [Deltaproteobacteria bacterium]|nr:radical SAM protein [Deltaproteobacteria bacterium]